LRRLRASIQLKSSFSDEKNRSDSVSTALANIPAFPPVALRVLQMLGDAKVSNSCLGEVMAADPVFSGEILRCANSSLYRQSGAVESLSQAVAVLGFARLRTLAMAVATRRYISGVLILTELRVWWRHSLACAVIAEALARLCHLREDQAYCAALFHDIGRLGLMAAHPEGYAALMREAEEQVRLGRELDFDAEERARFGMDRCEAANWLAGHWCLPAELRAGIESAVEKELGEVPDLKEVVRASCRLARSLGFGCQPELARPDYAAVVSNLPSWIYVRMPRDAQAFALELETIVRALDDDRASRLEMLVPPEARDSEPTTSSNEAPSARRRIKWRWQVPTAALVALGAGALLSTTSVAVLCAR
jgi:HD-like signal output (HDOD) protein